MRVFEHAVECARSTQAAMQVLSQEEVGVARVRSPTLEFCSNALVRTQRGCDAWHSGRNVTGTNAVRLGFCARICACALSGARRATHEVVRSYVPERAADVSDAVAHQSSEKRVEEGVYLLRIRSR
jgi:hypothetical protein